MDTPVTFFIRNRALIIAMALVALAGCSSTKMAYRYADWGIIWWVEDYIPLTREQKSQLNADLDNLRQWHCSTELPRYQAWLDELEADLARGTPDVDTIEYHQSRLLGFVPDLLDRATPVAVNLLQSLSDAQVEALAEAMAENQRELEEEMLAGSAEETAAARAERTRERVERWLGNLNTEQGALVRSWSENRGRQTQIWLEGRENWQRALLSALEKRDSPAFEAQIRELIVHSERARGPEYQAMIQESQRAMATLMHGLIEAGSDQHQDHLLARTDELNADFGVLTCSS